MNDTQELSHVQLLARAQAFVEKRRNPDFPMSPYDMAAISMWLMEFAEGEMGAKWRPIETAPKDRANVLLWCGDSAFIGRWDDNRYCKTPRPFWTYSTFYGSTWQRQHQPTHWMPLPDPPQA